MVAYHELYAIKCNKAELVAINGCAYDEKPAAFIHTCVRYLST